MTSRAALLLLDLLEGFLFRILLKAENEWPSRSQDGSAELDNRSSDVANHRLMSSEKIRDV